ncbi:hypothetical protein JQ621_31770 [Bradyrhizobium manausense]|nr:hypothetical protein [Bradyrhizobium manausense]MBR1092052.1 hypothetical protein [Bradyrhizobium manausense]
MEVSDKDAPGWCSSQGEEIKIWEKMKGILEAGLMVGQLDREWRVK